MKGKKREMTLKEEILNAVTHGIGLLLAIAALIVLVVFGTINNKDGWYLTGVIIYGITLILLYASSTLLHSFPKGKTKDFFEILDHASIYLLIAGTYTPFTLTVLRGKMGWIIFGIVWTLAIMGIIFKAIFIKRFKLLSTLMYIGMGWIIIFAIKPLFISIDTVPFFLLVLGGLLYSLGTIFYLWNSLKYGHAIWHIFVLGGSISHFITIFLL
ncbi:MAG: PAQR family membrane homeostasis protein TrhA [Fusobacteriota bacterium]